MNYFDYNAQITRPKQSDADEGRSELRSEYDANRAIKDGIVSREELDDPWGELR